MTWRKMLDEIFLDAQSDCPIKPIQPIDPGRPINKGDRGEGSNWPTPVQYPSNSPGWREMLAEIVPQVSPEPRRAAPEGPDHDAHVDAFYDFQERSAIMEYDGELERDEADRAAANIIRLDDWRQS